MGGMGYRRHEGRVMALKDILEGNNCCVVLVGADESGKEVRGGYQIFKEFDESKVRKYANATAKEAGIALVGVDVYKISCKLEQRVRAGHQA